MTSKKAIWTKLLVLFAFSLLLTVIGCSDDDDPVTPPADPTVTETIGAAGGTLDMPDKMNLEIPAGALAADIEFTAGPADTPQPLPTGYVAVSDFFDIEPSGTDFGQDADLTLFYNADDLPQFITEDMLEVFTHDGARWDDLGGPIDEDANSMTVQIGHLSQFVVVAPDPEPADDVYLQFEIKRKLYGAQTGGTPDGWDSLGAEFLGTVPGKIPNYLDGGDVSYGSWNLQRGMGSYYYSNDTTPLFLDMATNYDLVVEGSLEVTPLTLAIATMAGVPSLTNVADDAELALEGFEVTWDGTDQGGTVEIHLDADAGGSMFRTADNTGSFTFSEQALQGLSAGPGTIRLVWLFETPLPGEGYLEACRTKYEAENEIEVIFTGGGEAPLRDYTAASMPSLTIPDGPSGGGAGAPAIDAINMPITGVVDSVRVYLDISHNYMSDLVVKLTSPDGTQLRTLFIGEGGETDGRIQGWYPGDFVPKDDLSGFDGETAGGNWTLTCQDYSNGVSGVLNMWQLQVFYR